MTIIPEAIGDGRESFGPIKFLPQLVEIEDKETARF